MTISVPPSKPVKPLTMKASTLIIVIPLILTLFTIGIYKSICDYDPQHLHLVCGVMNTSTSQVFRCKTDLGYYICTNPLKFDHTCNSAIYQSSWGECTYIAGTLEEPYYVDPSKFTNNIATCTYEQPMCGTVESLVNMRCCQFENVQEY